MIGHARGIQHYGPVRIRTRSPAEFVPGPAELRPEVKVELRSAGHKNLFAANRRVNCQQLVANRIAPNEIEVISRHYPSLRRQVVPGEDECRGRYAKHASG